MRDTPFSEDLAIASSRKEINILYKEIGGLLTRLFKTDLRTLKRIGDRKIYNTRVELYSKLYRETYSKYKAILKKEGRDSSHLTNFDNIHKQFQYGNVEETEEEEDTEKQIQDRSKETYTTLHNLTQQYLNELEEGMGDKKIFKKDDPEVKKLAIHNSLAAFIEKYKDEIGPTTLTKMYHQIRNDAVGPTEQGLRRQTRVGKDEVDEPLGVESPVGIEIDKLDDVKVIVETTEVTVEPGDALPEGTKAIIKVDGVPIGEMKNVKLVDVEEDDVEEKINLHELPKSEQDDIVRTLLDEYGWELKAKQLKPHVLELGYLIVDYDAIYYPIERVKRQKAKEEKNK